MSNLARVKECVAVAGTYCGLGLSVPIVPTAVAVIAVVIVRILVWTKTQSPAWNVAVILLCSIAAFVTVEGSDMNTFRAFWTGVGYGALGVGIVEIGKSAMTSALRERFAKAMGVLFGVSTEK